MRRTEVLIPMPVGTYCFRGSPGSPVQLVLLVVWRIVENLHPTPGGASCFQNKVGSLVRLAIHYIWWRRWESNPSQIRCEWLSPPWYMRPQKIYLLQCLSFDVISDVSPRRASLSSSVRFSRSFPGLHLSGIFSPFCLALSNIRSLGFADRQRSKTAISLSFSKTPRIVGLIFSLSAILVDRGGLQPPLLACKTSVLALTLSAPIILSAIPSESEQKYNIPILRGQV